MNLKLMMVWSAAVVLTACGGGGGGSGGGGGGNVPAETRDTVPASALASPMALVDWARAVPAGDSDEPLALSDLVPPKTDTEEPRPIG